MKTKLSTLLLLSFLFTHPVMAEEVNACRQIIKASKHVLKSIDDSKEVIDRSMKIFDANVTAKNFQAARVHIDSAMRTSDKLAKEIRSQIEDARRGTYDCRSGQRDRLDKFASKLRSELLEIEALQNIITEFKARL